MSEERILALFDTHIPHHIPLDLIMEFAEDFKPTIVVLGGDMHDFGSVCHWVADQSRALDGGTIEQNYAELKKFLFRPLDKAAPKAKWKYLEGNHEYWVHIASEANPNGRGFWDLKKNIPASIEIFPINKSFRASEHLIYVHGNRVLKYHAYHMVHDWHKSVFYGHVHDVQTYTEVSPIDETQFMKGQSCGCLCHMNPHYMRNRPNKWVNGFNYAYIEKETGFFNDVQVCIVEGKFWANGRRYK